MSQNVSHPVLGRDLAAIEVWLPLLEAGIPEVEAAGGYLVHLGQDPDHPGDIDLGMLPLRGVHPVDALSVVPAPPNCQALGVVMTGWSAPLGEGRPSEHPLRRRVCSTILADRAGNVTSRVLDERGDLVADGAGEGAVLDALRDALARTS